MHVFETQWRWKVTLVETNNRCYEMHVFETLWRWNVTSFETNNRCYEMHVSETRWRWNITWLEFITDGLKCIFFKFEGVGI